MNSQCSRKWRTLAAYSNQLFSIYIHDRKRGNGFSIQHHAFRLFIKLRDYWHQWWVIEGGCGSSSQEMLHHLTIAFSYLSRPSAHESAFLCPQTHPALAPSPSLQFLHLLPLPQGHLEWLHLCSLNDLYSYYLSVQHFCRANESLYHSVPRHPFPLRYQHYPDSTLFYSKPELHGWTLQLLFLI